MGFGRRACLKGTGILLSQLEHPESRLTFQQELAFYRNALQLTGDPLIGLKLGEPFIPQRYGLFGYALLSAPTLRRAMNLAVNFGQLTFSFFSFEFGEKDGLAWFAMKDPPPIERALHDVYLDRDMAAAVVDFGAIMGRPFPAGPSRCRRYTWPTMDTATRQNTVSISAATCSFPATRASW